MVLDRENSAYHNGGSVDFGPDGFLYIALGEGVHPKVTKLASESLRAGIMRVDVDKLGGALSSPISAHVAHGTTQGYFVPNDNPFISDDRALDEYWAMGLRNPFRISFDAKTGELWAGDVGSTVWEEVNKVVKGSNYLYPYIEGPKTSDFVVADDLIGEARHPDYTYKHSAFDRAVIGGVVYRGSALPALDGVYLFGDNFSGKIFGIDTTGPSSIGDATVIAQAQQYAQRGISSITYSPEGEVFVTLLGSKANHNGQLMILKTADGQVASNQNEEANDAPHVYDAQATKSLFLEMCARCHGNQGDGKGPDAASFDVKIADFTQPGTRDKQTLVNIIKNGGAANQLSPYMPPWQVVLSDNEIDDLVRYIGELNSSK